MKGTVAGPISAAIFQLKIATGRLGKPSAGRPATIPCFSCWTEYQELVKLTLRLENLERKIRRHEDWAK